MSKLVSVKFIRAHAAYIADDIAGFPAEHAERLVAGKVAEFVQAAEAPKNAGNGGKPPAAGGKPQGAG